MEIIFPGLPAGVQSEVRMAQYLGILIGVLMEDGKYLYLVFLFGIIHILTVVCIYLWFTEIPTGLELIGKGVEQRIASASSSTRNMYAMRGFDMKRIVLPALLRLAVGYTFLCCLFLVVVQEQTVLDIFFDGKASCLSFALFDCRFHPYVTNISYSTRLFLSLVLALEFIENIDDVIFAISKVSRS